MGQTQPIMILKRCRTVELIFRLAYLVFNGRGFPGSVVQPILYRLLLVSCNDKNRLTDKGLLEYPKR